MPLAHPHLFAPIRLLIVLDGQHGLAGSFGQEVGGKGYPWFGLTHVVSALGKAVSPTITVTKAHRQTDPNYTGSDIKNTFKFGPSLADQYDVIWLIGCSPWDYSTGGSPTSNPPPALSNLIPDEQEFAVPNLSGAEITNLAQFMKQGGGVLAVGDHGSLGASLSAQVQRVRQMRLWFETKDGTGAPPSITTVGTSYRINTVQPNLALTTIDAEAAQSTNGSVPLSNEGAEVDSIPYIPFENQSDDIPAPITPKVYPIYHEGGVVFPWKHPLTVVHPLLDLGSNGVLAALPDHMHEGTIPDHPSSYYAPLTWTDGTLEFPKLSDDLQPLPDIIATGTSLPDDIWLVYQYSDLGAFSGDPNPGRAGTYGVIGAYDGQPVGVGRVAVDSTWHHFFDLNLIGDQDIVQEDSVDPNLPNNDPRSQGFNASPSGTAFLAKFDRYYQNLAIWLAQPTVLSDALSHGLWLMVNDGHIRKVLVEPAARLPERQKGLGDLAVRHLHKHKMTKTLLIDHIVAALGYRLLPPWFHGHAGSRPVLEMGHAEHLLRHVLGAALIRLHENRPQIKAGDPAAARFKILQSVSEALHQGVKAWCAELATLDPTLVGHLLTTLGQTPES